MLKIEDLEVGQIILDDNGHERTIMVVSKLFNVVVLSYPNQPDKMVSVVWTIEQLNRRGFKLKSDYPEYKEDQPLMVKQRDNHPWGRRLFAYFKDGKLWCWMDGGNKWTSKGKVCHWNHYRLPTEEELGE